MTKLTYPVTGIATDDHDDRLASGSIAGRLVSRWWVGYNMVRKKTGSAELSAASLLRICL
jgi:hypothetical protein